MFFFAELFPLGDKACEERQWQSAKQIKSIQSRLNKIKNQTQIFVSAIIFVEWKWIF